MIFFQWHDIKPQRTDSSTSNGRLNQYFRSFMRFNALIRNLCGNSWHWHSLPDKNIIILNIVVLTHISYHNVNESHCQMFHYCDVECRLSRVLYKCKRENSSQLVSGIYCVHFRLFGPHPVYGVEWVAVIKILCVHRTCTMYIQSIQLMYTKFIVGSTKVSGHYYFSFSFSYIILPQC